MSSSSTAIALHHSRAKGTTKLILLGIAEHDGDGGAWPTVATLAKYGNCNRSTVQRAIAELEKLGEIKRYVQAGGDHRYAEWERPNRYAFKLRCPGDCDGTSRHKTRRDVARILDLEPAQLAALADDDGAAPMRPPTPAASTRPPAASTRPGGAAPMRPKPSRELTTNLPEAYSSDRVRAIAPCGHEFIDDRHCTHGCPPVDLATGELL